MNDQKDYTHAKQQQLHKSLRAIVRCKQRVNIHWESFEGFWLRVRVKKEVAIAHSIHTKVVYFNRNQQIDFN